MIKENNKIEDQSRLSSPPLIKKVQIGLRLSKSANIDDIENNKDMDAASDSSNSQNKSLSVKFEEIDQNAQYKFIDNECTERKKINYLDNMTR